MISAKVLVTLWTLSYVVDDQCFELSILFSIEPITSCLFWLWLLLAPLEVVPGHGVIGQAVGNETGHGSPLMTNLKKDGVYWTSSVADVDLLASQRLCNWTHRLDLDYVFAYTSPLKAGIQQFSCIQGLIALDCIF